MRDPKEFRERFQRWKNGENYWEQRGINMNTQQSQDQQADLLTPEQLTAIEAALEYYTSGKDAVDDVPPERVGIFDPETTHIQSFETGNQVPKRGYIVDNTGTMYAVDNRGQQYNSVLPEVEVVGDRSKFSQKLANLDQQNVQPADNVFVQNNLNSKAPNPEQIYLNRYKGVDGMSGLENGIFEGIQWTPFVGDAIDLLQGVSDAVDGNYLSAGFTGAMFLLPFGNKFRRLGNRADKILKSASKTNNVFKDAGQGKQFQKYIAQRKIKGKTPIPINDDLGFSLDVTKGLDEIAQKHILSETINRNADEFLKAGVSEQQIDKYVNSAIDEMNNVNVGRFKNSDYIDAGEVDTYGFYDRNRNFISVRMGPDMPQVVVENHEGRHLLDYKIDDEIIMPTKHQYGIDFDVDKDINLMQKVKYRQNEILYQAFDNDFITLPSSKYAGSLSGYKSMNREAITTNFDARRSLFESIENSLGLHIFGDIPLHIQNKMIDEASDQAIFEAVENANGYGKRFIQKLRDEGKLSPQKAQQFRDSFKYVGAIAAPMGVVGLGASITSDQKNTYNRGKDKGIHINPKNRGKFNALKKRTGKTTEQLTHSKNPLTRKRAIFAQNAKKWKKK